MRWRRFRLERGPRGPYRVSYKSAAVHFASSVPIQKKKLQTINDLKHTPHNTVLHYNTPRYA